MDPAATNRDQIPKDLDDWFPILEDITSLGAGKISVLNFYNS